MKIGMPRSQITATNNFAVAILHVDWSECMHLIVYEYASKRSLNLHLDSKCSSLESTSEDSLESTSEDSHRDTY